MKFDPTKIIFLVTTIDFFTVADYCVRPDPNKLL